MSLRLYEARLDLDRRCNYRCRYCLSQDGTQRFDPISVESLARFFSSLSKLCWRVNLSCGGEPLLHPRFGEVIAAADEHLRSCDTTIVTNGSLLDESKIAVLASSSLTSIFVSVDTCDPDLYCYLCGTNVKTAAKALRGTKLLAQACRQRRGPSVAIIAIAMKSTLPRFEALARWAVDNGIDGVRIHSLVSERSHEFIDSQKVSNEEALPVFRKMRRILARGGVTFEHPGAEPATKARWYAKDFLSSHSKCAYALYAARKLFSMRRLRGCPAAGRPLSVDVAGTVYFCPKQAVGSLTSSGDHEIRRRLAEKIRYLRHEPFPECEQCGYALT